MMRVDTGTYQYEFSDVEDSFDVKSGLSDQYSEIIDAGIEVAASNACTDVNSNKIAKIALWAHETIDTLADALDGHDDDRRAVVYFICQQLVEEAFVIGRAIGEVKSLRSPARARSAQTSPEREAVITAAIDAVDPQHPKRAEEIAFIVERGGERIGVKAIRERIKKSPDRRRIIPARRLSGDPSF